MVLKIATVLLPHWDISHGLVLHFVDLFQALTQPHPV